MPSHTPMTANQLLGLLWVLNHPVYLDQTGKRFIPDPALATTDPVFLALVAERPNDRTLRSVMERGWLANTPGRRVGVTVEGRQRVSPHYLYPGGGAKPMPYYLPAPEVQPGALIDLGRDPVADPDPDAPCIYKDEFARVLNPADDPTIMPPTGPDHVALWVMTSGEDDVITFPREHLVRQVGTYTDDRDTVWDGA